MRAFVTLSSKGQLVIPAAMREALGLAAGDRIDATVDVGGTTITLRRAPSLDELVEVASTIAERSSASPLTNVDEFYQANRESRS